MISPVILRAYFALLVLTCATLFTAQESAPNFESLHLVSSFSPTHPDQVSLQYLMLDDDEQDNRTIATVTYKSLNEETAYISDFIVLPQWRSKGLGSKLFFQDLPTHLKRANYKNAQWEAGYFTVAQEADDLKNQPVIETTDTQYNQELPRLIRFYERGGGVAAKQANGSYKYLIIKNSGRRLIPFSMALAQEKPNERKYVKYKRSRPQPLSAHQA